MRFQSTTPTGNDERFRHVGCGKSFMTLAERSPREINADDFQYPTGLAPVVK